MKQIQVHQFAPTANSGDGITNGMFYMQRILRSLGFISEIYVENNDPALESKVLNYEKLDKEDKNQLLFIHYSIYYDFEIWIDAVAARKMMIYHNITPYDFFQKDSYLYTMCKTGREYLPAIKNKVEASIGDSDLNSSELLELGYKNVTTIPLLMDIDEIRANSFNKELFDEAASEFSIIFIGRIAKNKCQHDLIEIANIYMDMCEDFKMYIIGGTTDQDYEAELKELVVSYELQNNVIFTGKISNEDLFAHYKSANLFLCMSEHEGFGIPLIESMLFDLPVLAYNSSNIKSTLNGGGILFNEKSHQHIAATIQLLRENHAFKTEILNTQREALKVYEHNNIVKKLVSFLQDFGIDSSFEKTTQDKPVSFQFEGPFDSSYSLAMLNRYSALAFEKKYPEQVSLFSTEGGGDYEADKSFLKKHPEIDAMAKKSQKAMQCDVVFRNMYPPRVTAMKGKLNILNSYGWEESGFVREYVNSFNENLDGITVMSKYVKDVLTNNGVRVPIAVVGLGAEHILKTTPKELSLKTQKSFKFLHISSCFPRKGIDILLKAYVDVFSKDDDVVLIIKTFPNPHNNVEELIQEINQDKNAPEIELINKDLDDSYISWLYQNSSALVAPSFGEGFGLPMAEAMLFKLPVITTAFGGQSDFCTVETSWLIDYSFEKADTHLELFNSYWAKPDQKDLQRVLKKVVALSKEEKESKTKKAYELITQEFSWSKYQSRTDDFLQELKDVEIFDTSTKNIAWVSSYNTKCGIATYSEFILNELDDDRFKVIKYANYAKELVDDTKEDNVLRCWDSRFDTDNEALIQNILTNKPDTALINFNFGFFSMKNLGSIIEKLSLENIKIVIIFHSVADVDIVGLEASLSWIKAELKKVDKLLVHNIDDLNLFKDLGLSNMEIFPHGVQNRTQNEVRVNDIPRTIASYGFLLPHKGILELIESFAIVKKDIPDVKLLLVNSLYPVPESENYYEICKAKIQELNLQDCVEMHTDFLSDADSFKLLDKADLLVMPYRPTNESASGAIRYAVSTMKPVLCTKQPIFNDVADIVHFMEFDVESMAESMRELIHTPSLLNKFTQKQQLWIQEHDWKNIALKVQTFIS